MNNAVILNNFITPVQPLIPQVEERIRRQVDGFHPDLKVALEHLLSSGGKRVRPVVVLLMGGMLGAEQEQLITLSAAIELLHTATLVHDDLIDGALLRRGIATLNAHWSPGATVLAGDFFFARAARLAAQIDSAPVIQLFAETLAIIVNGEFRQMFSSRSQVSRDEYLQRIYAKTASLFETAASTAAMLSPATVVDQVGLARSYGYNIGMAFQMIDDVLDFTGEQEKIGKPVASDLRHGLITLPTILYLETTPDDEDLKAILNGNVIDQARLEHVISAIRKSGAIDRAFDEARLFVNKALEALTKLPDGHEHLALEDLAVYIIGRRS